MCLTASLEGILDIFLDHWLPVKFKKVLVPSIKFFPTCPQWLLFKDIMPAVTLFLAGLNRLSL